MSHQLPLRVVALHVAHAAFVAPFASLKMSAYVIVDIHITDPVAYEGYKRDAAPTVSLYKGRYLARGGKVTILEGEPDPQRVVILEFPTADDALAWWNSPEYMPFKQIRHAAATTEMLLVEGV